MVIRKNLNSKFTFIIFFILLSFISNIVFAQNCIRAVPILTGEISKCDGVLYPESLVKEHLLLQVKADELKQKLSISKETCEKKKTVCNKYIAQADKRIARLSNPPFWKTPVFNFFSGVFLSITSALTISYALH